MNITKTILENMIREEISLVMNEQEDEVMRLIASARQALDMIGGSAGLNRENIESAMMPLQQALSLLDAGGSMSPAPGDDFSARKEASIAPE
jgi:hypothetical protein